ncbi:type 11 methyltransferase [Candidatus Omnitrophus magneticus]|uniref:Type 11 methyltransferase n=1 Tax=Candidatus Omnitrophus magneticus TaxID=1609969 RepID=A0A0F0CPP2_9BACT|nr:type 11 methyltransferase [Candidatus Omnitrophus magneticus]
MIEKINEHYFSNTYDTKKRFISYWHQINEIIKTNPKNILEIGAGNKFVSIYLKQKNFNVTTVDINPNLEPDVVANVIKMPFKNNSFHTVNCCETLEHMPYENFSKALSEIYRVAEFHAVISIPDITKILHVPYILQKYADKFFKKAIPRDLDKHYWEIGKKMYPLSRIIKDIKHTGFIVVSSYNVPENLYHKFFILKKIKKHLL